MKYLLILLLFFCFDHTTFGQHETIPQEKITDVQTIAELYDKLVTVVDFNYWSFNYETDSLKIYDSSGKLKSSGLLNDTLLVKYYCDEAWIGDSINLTAYCKNTQTLIKAKRFRSACEIIHLMIKNKLLAISNGGVGDCTNCSIKIIYEWNKKNRRGKGFVLEPHSWCEQDDCYDLEKGATLSKLKDNFYLIKNTTYFGHYWYYTNNDLF